MPKTANESKMKVRRRRLCEWKYRYFLIVVVSVLVERQLSVVTFVVVNL